MRDLPQGNASNHRFEAYGSSLNYIFCRSSSSFTPSTKTGAVLHHLVVGKPSVICGPRDLPFSSLAFEFCRKQTKGVLFYGPPGTVRQGSEYFLLHVLSLKSRSAMLPLRATGQNNACKGTGKAIRDASPSHLLRIDEAVMLRKKHPDCLSELFSHLHRSCSHASSS